MLSNEIAHAYIDECGNFGYDFNKEGTSRYFLVCAVVVAPENVGDLVKAMRKQIQEGGELKSKAIGADHGKRFRILRELLEIPFHVVYIVIDKSKVYPDTGLTWKQSFIKFAHNLLYKPLATSFQYLKITADEYGDGEFMESFEKYVESKSGLLFQSYTFGFERSINNELLQLADFIAGTLYLGYENVVPKHYQAYLNLLKDKILYTETFPGEYKNYLVKENLDNSRFDREIAELSVRLATQYIQKYDNAKDTWEICRVFVLKRLLFELRINPRTYLNTKRLRILTRDYMRHDCSAQEFRAEVIGKLRDRGVLIASSDKGYKIPINLNEIYIHCNKMIQMINPMLARLQKFRRGVLLGTKNELDILAQSEYAELKAYFDLTEKVRKN